MISIKTVLTYLLGSTDPQPIAVHVEPFSTSVFKVLTWIFATTTKICTRDNSTSIYIEKLLNYQYVLLHDTRYLTSCVSCV